MKKLGYIDSMRGFAILMVVMVHTSHFGEFRSTNNYFREIVWAGRWGVPLFYIASAYTLFLSMNGRMRTENNPITNFFIRRFFRIAPLYYLAIFYYLFQDGFGSRYWLCDQSSLTLKNILSNVFFIHSFSPYSLNSVVPGGWSVAVEMSFYCFLPLIFKYITNLEKAIYFFTGSVVVMSISILFSNIYCPISCLNLWNEYVSMSLPFQLPVFALGIMMYFILTQNNTNGLTRSIGIFSITTLFLTIQFGWRNVLPINTLYSILFLGFGLFLSRFDWKLFSNLIMEHIGKISYSMYLIHIAVLFWMQKTGLISFLDQFFPEFHILNFLIRFFLAVLFTVGISTITFHFIEIPFQELGRKIIKKRESKTSGINFNY